MPHLSTAWTKWFIMLGLKIQSPHLVYSRGKMVIHSLWMTKQGTLSPQNQPYCCHNHYNKVVLLEAPCWAGNHNCAVCQIITWNSIEIGEGYVYAEYSWPYSIMHISSGCTEQLKMVLYWAITFGLSTLLHNVIHPLAVSTPFQSFILTCPWLCKISQQLVNLFPAGPEGGVQPVGRQ